MSPHRVYNHDDIKNPADYLIVDNGNGTKGIVWMCPGCKDVVATVLGLIVVQEEPLTMQPSLNCKHIKNGIECGYHVFIENGIIRPA